MKILIVEDEKKFRKSMVSCLSEEGYLCESADNFEEGAKKINVYKYDCYINDIMLRKGSGLDLIM